MSDFGIGLRGTISKKDLKRNKFVRVALKPEAISPSDTAPIQWQNVHFGLAPDGFAPHAEDLGLTVAQFRREMECYWQFCGAPGDAEDYPFTRYPSNVMRTRQTAGFAAGPFASHVFKTVATHTVSVLIHVRGRLFEASRTITVAARDYGTIGVCDPDDAAQAKTDFEAETGLTVASGQTFTDIDVALKALDDGTLDTLACRRGKTYVSQGQGAAQQQYTIDADGPNALPQCVIGFGGGPNDLIDIELDWGIGKVEAFDGIFVVADGTAGPHSDTEFFFEDSQLGSWTHYAIYVDNVLQDPATYSIVDLGTGYHGITFTAGNEPADGAEIRGFQTKAPSNDNPASPFFPTETGTGKFVVEKSPRLFEVVADRALLRDIRIRGGYDASNPGYFDVRDLTTFDHYYAAAIGVLFTDGAKGATIFNFETTGVRTGVSFADGEACAAVNGRLTNWGNYGSYYSGHLKACFVGLSIDQNIGAMNAAGAKVSNYPFRYNAPDHGPLRSPTTVQAVVNRCYLSSRNNWGVSEFFGDGAQPTIRMPQSEKCGQSVSFSENTIVGGSSSLPGGGPANEAYPIPTVDLVVSHGNVSIGLATTDRFVGGLVPLTSINDYFIHAVENAGANFRVANIAEGDGYFMSGDFDATQGRIFLNPTVVVGERTAQTAVVWPQTLLQTPGLKGKIVDAEVVASAGASVTFSTSYGLGSYDGFHRRVWWLAAADAAAIDADDATYPTAADKALAKELAATKYDTVSDQDADFTITHAGKNENITIEWKAGQGSWAVGDVVWVTNETTVEDVQRWDTSGAEVTPGTPETFCINQLSADTSMPDPDVRNPLVVVTGDWTSFRLFDDDTPITDMTTAMADFRPAAFAPLSAGYYQPQGGSSAIGAGTRTTYRDLLGTTGATLGALEPGSSISGWPALPSPPSDDATVSLTGGPFSAGQTITTADNVTYTAPSDLGSPAATVSPAIEVVRDPLTVPQRDVEATSITLEAGDKIRAILHIESEAGGRRRIPGTEVTVSSGSFTPETIRNVDATGATAAVAVLGGLTAVSGDRHFAFRMRVPTGAFSAQDDYGWMFGAASEGNDKLRGGGALNSELRWNPDGSYVDIVNSATFATDTWYSFLISELPSNNATPGATRFRVIRQVEGDPSETTVIDDTTITVGTDFATANSFWRIGDSGTHTPVFDLQHSLGVWTGGNPSFSDFFESDGTVKEWAANPTRGVLGMTCAWLFAGVDDFNAPAARNRGSAAIGFDALSGNFAAPPA